MSECDVRIWCPNVMSESYKNRDAKIKKLERLSELFLVSGKKVEFCIHLTDSFVSIKVSNIDHTFITHWSHIDHILITHWPHIDHAFFVFSFFCSLWFVTVRVVVEAAISSKFIFDNDKKNYPTFILSYNVLQTIWSCQHEFETTILDSENMSD